MLRAAHFPTSLTCFSSPPGIGEIRKKSGGGLELGTERLCFSPQNGSNTRLSNAAARLDIPLRAVTTDAGVDVLSFGGTKNGLMGAEAVIFLGDIGENAHYYRKQGMQLASKMRFLAAQIEALLTDDLWRRNAEHSNAMARRLEAAVDEIDAAEILYPVQSNAVFVRLPPASVAELQAKSFFYPWNEQQSHYRWMTSFDTTDEDIDAFTALLREIA
jgi:threonine aldolase